MDLSSLFLFDRFSSVDEHSVAEREEPIPLGDGRGIDPVQGGQSPFLLALPASQPRGERRHKHQERALRQMKIRDQGIDDAKVEARIDKEGRQIGRASCRERV